MMKSAFVGGVVALVSLATSAHARDQIWIVGSSTVFPFSSVVAEEFGKTTKFKTPVVESTGSGGGLKLFCGGVGPEHPDITNASRRIKKSEVERCGENGVKDVAELVIGFDGIVIANSVRAPSFDLTLQDVFRALAKTVPSADGKMIANPNTYWSDVNPKLPKIKIEVFGPPPTSGTRDAFVELAMDGGCETIPAIEALKKADKKAFKAVCRTIREDGAFIEAGENDNLIVQKLEANEGALGIFGYSYLDQNKDFIKGSAIAGVQPTFDNISAGKYPVSRALYLYVKVAHVGVIPGIKEYLAEFLSDKATGDYGYLVDKGLIPLPAKDHQSMRDQAERLSPLSM